MRNAIFKDIYNQFTPDRRVVAELMLKIEEEKPRRISFKPFLAVASVAALAVISLGVVSIIPRDGIVVVQNTMPSYSETKAPDTTVTDLTSAEKTTVPTGGESGIIIIDGEEETTATEVSASETVTSEISSVATGCTGEETTVTTIKSVTENPPVNTTASEKPPVTTTTVTEKPPVTTTTVTEKPPVTTTTVTEKPPIKTTVETTIESIFSEDTPEDIPEDIEVAIDDENVLKDFPVFDTLGEYYSFFGDNLSEKEVTVGYETSSNGFSSFTNKEADKSLAKTILDMTAAAIADENAPLKENDKWTDYIRLSIANDYTIDVRSNGTIQFSASGYAGIIRFTGDKAAYEKLEAYVAEIDTKFTITIEDSGKDSVDAEED